MVSGGRVGMDGGLVTQIINVLNSISTMMMKVPKNKKKCREMRGLMDALREELEPLTEGVMDTSVQAALQRFKDTLVSTETEVKKLQDGNDLVQFFQANRTAAKLNQLRQDLSQSMLHSALVASVSTTNQFRRMDQKIDYAISLLESLQSKVLPAVLLSLLITICVCVCGAVIALQSILI